MVQSVADACEESSVELAIHHWCREDLGQVGDLPTVEDEQLRRSSQAEATWLGVGVVVQNFISCLFNSYLFEFTLGWIYIFGVGVLGGMMLRQQAPAAAPDSVVAPDGKGR